MEAGKSRLERGLVVLEALASDESVEHGGLGVVRVSEIAGVDKAQVSRLLSSLAKRGLVDRDAVTLRYRLGWRLYTMAARAGDMLLTAAVPPVLDRLVGEFRESAFLVVRAGDEVITVLERVPRNVMLQASGWTGRSFPAYCSAGARALLLDEDDTTVEGIFATTRFEPLGPNSPADVEEFSRRVRRGRQDGFTIADEEFEAGLIAVAAPVRDPQGKIIAAINISGPKFRFGSDVRRAADALVECADELSVQLGRRDAERASPWRVRPSASRSA